MKNKPIEIREAIAYSRLVSNTFSPEECMVLHRYIAQDIGLTDRLSNKLQKLLKEVKEIRFTAPELKYNDAKELYARDPETDTWTKIN